MATSFDLPENGFLNKVSDRYLVGISPTELESYLDGLLISSFSWFRKCKTDLSYDATARTLDEDLDDDEIEILSLIMVQEWLKPKLNNIDVLKQNMSTRDYKMYSQANHIDSLKDLKESTRIEYKQMIREYVDIRTELSELYES